jgi:hypothetical protein
MHNIIHYARIVLEHEWKGKGQEKEREIMMGFHLLKDKSILMHVHCEQVNNIEK